MQYKSKLILVILLALSFGTVKAQETLSIYGKTYKVFPYRMEYSNSEKTDIPFYPGVLEDGEYVVLFAMPKSYSYPPDYKGTNDNPACILSIVDGKKEGPVVFYTNKLQKSGLPLVMLKGQYREGLKQGNWHYYNYSVYGKVRDSLVIPYDKDMKSGTQLQRFYDGEVETTEYKNGLKEGFRRSKGTSFHYVNDTLDGWQYDTLYDKPFRVYMNHGKRGDTLHMGKRDKDWVKIIILNEELDKKDISDSASLYADVISDNPRDLLYYVQESDLKHGFEYYSSNNYTGIYGKIETYDSFNNLKQIDYFVGNALRIAPMRKDIEESEIRSRKPKNHPYEIVKSGKKTLYLIKDKYTYENKIINQHPTLGSIYEEQWIVEGKTVLLQQYFVSNFSKQLIFKRKLGDFDYLNRGSAEINRSYADSIEEYTIWYYALQQGSAPNYFLKYKSLGYNQSGLRYQSFGYLKDQYINIVVTNSEDDSVLTILTGRAGISEFNDSQVIVQNLDYKNDGENSFAMVWADTVTLDKVSTADSIVLSYRSYLDKYNPEKSIKIYSSSAMLPLRMPKIYINFRPFSGALHLNIGGYDAANKIPIRISTNYLQEKVATVTIEGRYSNWDEFDYYNSSYYLDHLYVNGVEDGFAQGRITLDIDAYEIKRKKLKSHYDYQEAEVKAYYSNGLINGELFNNKYDKNLKLNYKKGKQTGMQFESGVADRQSHYEYEEAYNSSVFLNQKGQLDGVVSIDISGDKHMNIGMENGYPEGPYLIYYYNLLVDSGYFKDGKMHGDYKSWYFDQEQDTTILTFQGTVKGNYLRDTVKTYFPDGRPSCVLVLQDSIQALHVVNESINESQASLALYGVRNSQSVYVSSSTDYITTAIDSSRESDRNTWNNTMYFERNLIVYCNEEGIGASQNDRLIEFSPDWDGYYKYYYKSGLLNQEGTVDKGLRSGLWKFYNEAGYVFKEVYYKSDSTIDPYENNEKLYYKGICKGFDNFGKPIYEGYIMDENFSYACATEGAISFQKLYYTKVYDSTGRDILRSDAHIPVADYQISGAKLFDGYWFNGKRDSLWKTYNAGGNPESIGFYRNGMKHGRWIQGDLSGVNYIDNACFKVEDSYAIDELRKELEFTETLFDDGKVLETHTTEVQTDGFSTSYSWYGFTKIEKIPWYWGKRRIENHSYDYYKSHSNHNILRMIARSIFGRRRYRHHDGF